MPHLLEPNDKAFTALLMRDSPVGDLPSAIPAISGLDHVALDALVHLNRERLSFMGFSQFIFPEPSARHTGLDWSWQYLPRKFWGRFFEVSGSLPEDEVFLLFADGVLLHAGRPYQGEFFRMMLKHCVTPGLHLTLISSRGLVTTATGAEILRTAVDMNASDVQLVDIAAQSRKGFMLDKKNNFKPAQFARSEQRDRYWEFYEDLRCVFSQSLGLPLLLTHGTLLGLVRNGDLLPHDDDFDCAYVSGLTDLEAVSRERFAIAAKLRDAGMDVKIGFTGHLKIKRGKLEIDCMPAWFEGGFYNVSIYSSLEMSVHEVLPPVQVLVRGHLVQLPAEAERFLALNYGENWRQPDPSYRAVYPASGRRVLKCFQADQEAFQSNEES